MIIPKNLTECQMYMSNQYFPVSLGKNDWDPKNYVKFDEYSPAASDWNPKKCCSIKTTTQKAVKILASSTYSIKRENEDKQVTYHSLVDLKEVVIDGHSYPVTNGRCSGAVALQMINKIIEDHFKNFS